MTLEEGPEGGRLLLAALDGAQHHLVVVAEVGVDAHARGKLDKQVAQARVLRVPVSQPVLQVLQQLPGTHASQ